MGKLIRCISEDGTLTVMAADTTDIVNRAQEIHGTSAVISAALGRLLTAASLMGSALKGTDDSVTLRINGNGPAGTVLAASDSQCNVRGYAVNSVVELPLNDKGKLDVSGAVGKDGFLTVIKDLGLKEPYVGQVPIISGEIAEDITNYFATSEQIPTICALGVLVNPDLTIRKAGGFIIQLLPTQLLPTADDTVIDKVEKCIGDIEPVTTMLDKGLTPETVCRTVLPAFKLDVLDTSDPEYRCSCSRERVSRALISMGRDELEKLKEDEQTEVCCQFCDKKYVFTPSDIDRLLEASTAKEDK